MRDPAASGPSTFIGNDHVSQNWAGLFGRVPDIKARVLRSVEDGDTLWSEWEMTGTTTDGVNFRAGGVAILGVEDDRFPWARFYLDPVDDEPTDASGRTPSVKSTKASVVFSTLGAGLCALSRLLTNRKCCLSLSLIGCGARSSTRISISRATPTAARPEPASAMDCLLQHAPHQALGIRTPMAVWRDAADRRARRQAVDMTLRLDNARALPTCPQPQQQQEDVAHDNHTNQRLDYAGLLWPLGRWNFDFRCRANQSVAANANRPVRG